MTSKLTVNQCVYRLGPYKGYMGRAEYDADAGIFHGQAMGTKDIVTFQAKTVGRVQTAFIDSIDDYLDFCAARGEKPEKPFSGRFVARIDPDLHRRLSMLAEASGKSLNTFVAESLETLTIPQTIPRAKAPAHPTRSRSRKTPRKVRRKRVPRKK